MHPQRKPSFPHRSVGIHAKLPDEEWDGLVWLVADLPHLERRDQGEERP